MALTSWTDLLARLERDPESDILASMLTDELQEARGMSALEAGQYVATARKVARDALDISKTAEVIRAAGPKYIHLVEKIRRALGQPAGAAFVLFLVSGDDPPRIGVGVEQLAADDPGPGLYVVLPCGWARAVIDRCGLPLYFPKSPKRLRKFENRVRPMYRISIKSPDWTKPT